MSAKLRRMEMSTQEVPKSMRIAFYAILIVCGLDGMFRIGAYTSLPVKELLDAWVIALILTFLLRGKVQNPGLLLFLGAYLLTRIIPAMATESPMQDFLGAYRWVLYLIAYAISVGRHWGGSLRNLSRVLLTLIAMALIKALLTILILGFGPRSGLLTENNFELALFAGAVAIIYPQLERGRFAILIMLGSLTVLSGSRSGAFAFLAVTVYALSQSRIRGGHKVFLGLYALPILAAVPVWIFAERSGPTGSIDRVNFFNVFLGETRSWNLLEWLFGTVPITPLSSAGCSQLSYYQALFASEGGGTCYSVILHAFAMRVVFDAGIIGLIIAFAVAWIAMRKGGVASPLALCLLAVALTNSLSVSGLNNAFVAVPILLAIQTSGYGQLESLHLRGGPRLLDTTPVGAAGARRAL